MRSGKRRSNHVGQSFNMQNGEKTSCFLQFTPEELLKLTAFLYCTGALCRSLFPRLQKQPKQTPQRLKICFKQWLIQRDVLLMLPQLLPFHLFLNVLSVPGNRLPSLMDRKPHCFHLYKQSLKFCLQCSRKRLQLRTGFIC